MAKINRTSLGLRNALFEELDLLRNGESTPQRAAVVAKLAVQIVNTVNLELNFQKYVSHPSKEIQELSAKPMKLGD